ncbi:MAG TPA: exodeoxyribonuclease VII small subunit [Clostridiales bacterium]|nr:exodeoxyribonuclease VII small subunit [Clostridiales bacterium]
MSKEKSFEECMQDLDQIVKNIESGKMSLEDTLKEFSEGMRLSKYLLQMLDEIDKKVEMIMENDQNEVKIVDFEA